jgi:hypothetical protein
VSSNVSSGSTGACRPMIPTLKLPREIFFFKYQAARPQPRPVVAEPVQGKARHKIL